MPFEAAASQQLELEDQKIRKLRSEIENLDIPE